MSLMTLVDFDLIMFDFTFILHLFKCLVCLFVIYLYLI